MSDRLPHDPYIDAVVTALSVVDLKPDYAWTSDTENDPYATGDGPVGFVTHSGPSSYFLPGGAA